MLVFFELTPEDLHECLLLLLLLFLHLLFRGNDLLLRHPTIVGCLLWIGVEVVVDELEDEVLVIVQSLNVAVQLEEMSGDLVLQIVEFHDFLHFLA
jgi:hypothetical protein